MRTIKVTADLVLGVMIMGITGFIIGLNLGGPAFIAFSTLLGVILGGFVSTLKARRFFLSILSGTVLGGILAWILGGPETVIIGAGSGGAMGGFIGINIELYMRG
jgi:hypothetical protein